MRKNNQTGRSMVEMLGVLAIIGVLSVGAIAGYQKAMMKYKLNKQSQQVNQVINTVGRYLRSFDDVSKTITTSTIRTDILIKLGEIPKEMIKNGDTSKVYDVFNTTLDFYLYPSNDKRLLVHIFPDLTKKSWLNLEICRNLLLVLKENSDIISAVFFVSNYNIDGTKSDSFFGDKLCRKDNVCLKSMTQEQMYNACLNHYDQKTFWFDVFFYL